MSREPFDMIHIIVIIRIITRFQSGVHMVLRS
jgi:hypothetical protein